MVGGGHHVQGVGVLTLPLSTAASCWTALNFSSPSEKDFETPHSQALPVKLRATHSSLSLAGVGLVLEKGDKGGFCPLGWL